MKMNSRKNNNNVQQKDKPQFRLLFIVGNKRQQRNPRKNHNELEVWHCTNALYTLYLFFDMHGLDFALWMLRMESEWKRSERHKISFCCSSICILTALVLCDYQKMLRYRQSFGMVYMFTEYKCKAIKIFQKHRRFMCNLFIVKIVLLFLLNVICCTVFCTGYDNKSNTEFVVDYFVSHSDAIFFTSLHLYNALSNKKITQMNEQI